MKAPQLRSKKVFGLCKTAEKMGWLHVKVRLSVLFMGRKDLPTYYLNTDHSFDTDICLPVTRRASTSPYYIGFLSSSCIHHVSAPFIMPSLPIVPTIELQTTSSSISLPGQIHRQALTTSQPNVQDEGSQYLLTVPRASDAFPRLCTFDQCRD